MPKKQDILDLLKNEPNDPFLLYALALQLVNEGDFSGAVKQFELVLAADAGYSAAYHQKAKAHMSLDEIDHAKKSLHAGIAAAQKAGDLHAAKEMAELLSELG